MADSSAHNDASRLVDFIASLGRCIVAFSGGVDSAVVAAAAMRADQRRGVGPIDRAMLGSIAVTADSPSVSREQLKTACDIAREIGIRHEIVETSELDRADYQANDRRRCFFCKQTLYARLAKFASSNGLFTVLSGTNADDLGDYRPGIEAGRDACVLIPLADLGITKRIVRDIAHIWNLSVANRPAQPCLSSRLAYGVAVTSERLNKIELAEAFMRGRGYSPLRVRMLPEEEGSIEVSLASIDRLKSKEEWESVASYLCSIGFSEVSVDPQGFRSGSMNTLVQIRSTISAVPNRKISEPIRKGV